MTAIVLLSGGMDSTTVGALAVKNHGAKNVIGLTINYGQRHQKEISSAKKVAKFLGILLWQEIVIPDIFKGSDSSLINWRKGVPEKSYAEIQGVSPTYVPFRNGVLLSSAAAVALSQGADLIYYGAHADDAAEWAYPDCTPEFNGAIGSAIYVGTYHQVRLIVPFQYLTKAEIVEVGVQLGAPFHLTWTCYNGKEKACGKCSACLSRLEAFSKAGVADPIEYEGGRHACK
ncbi:MAG: 7-cyano-7-deazaguanine synthase QueC [Candidatus Heimdallarchaeaceae archaeon]